MKRTIIYFWKNNPSFGIRWDTKIVLIGLNHWGHSKGDSRVRTMQNLLTNTTKTWRNVMLLFIKLKKLFKSASFRISPRSFEQHKLHVLILHCYFTQTISFKSFTANTIQTKGQRTSNIKRTANIEYEKSWLIITEKHKIMGSRTKWQNRMTNRHVPSNLSYFVISIWTDCEIIDHEYILM